LEELALIDTLRKFLYKLKSMLILRYIKLINPGEIIIDKNAKINNMPIIRAARHTSININSNVLLNSKNKSYHLNMHSPVKIIVDRKGGYIEIGENTRIHGSCIHAYSNIYIGKNCLIAANCQIFDGNGHDLSFNDVSNRINSKGTAKPIFIEDNVWIGANSIILPGVRIGQGSVIGAGSVVTKDIPSMTLAAGNPAKVIKFYESSDERDLSSY